MEKTFSAAFVDGVEFLSINGKEYGWYKIPLNITNSISMHFTPALNGQLTEKIRVSKADSFALALRLLPSVLSNVYETNIQLSDIFNKAADAPDVEYYGEITALLESAQQGQITDLAKGFIMLRGSQAPMSPLFTKEGLGGVHHSSNLIALAWAELWYSARTGIERVKVCQFCGKIYIAPKNNPDKGTCGEYACNKARVIQNVYNNDLEAYRADVNERKIKSRSNRAVGRPRKTDKGGK